VRHAYILIGKPSGKTPLGKYRSRWKETTEVEIKCAGSEGVNWINLAFDMDQWRTLLREKITNLRV
jgi:hypothetical protein